MQSLACAIDFYRLLFSSPVTLLMGFVLRLYETVFYGYKHEKYLTNCLWETWSLLTFLIWPIAQIPSPQGIVALYKLAV